MGDFSTKPSEAADLYNAKGLTILKDFAASKSQNPQWRSRVEYATEGPVVYSLIMTNLCVKSIVAIHGLNGHAINTWSDGGTIWFRDILPSLVPEAQLRISSYGYLSAVISSGANSQMLDFALGLLSALETLRRSTDTSTIPIIFLCHSLGGILFKKCLLIANDRSKL